MFPDVLIIEVSEQRWYHEGAVDGGERLCSIKSSNVRMECESIQYLGKQKATEIRTEGTIPEQKIRQSQLMGLPLLGRWKEQQVREDSSDLAPIMIWTEHHPGSIANTLQSGLIVLKLPLERVRNSVED